jgi:hypothetical protein
MKDNVFARNDRKPLTPLDLVGILEKLQQYPKDWEKMKHKPIKMSSDEEGNDIMHLDNIEILASGQITLWPVHI